MYKRGDKIKFREKGNILTGEIEITGGRVFGVKGDDDNRYIVNKYQIINSKYQEQKSKLNI